VVQHNPTYSTTLATHQRFFNSLLTILTFIGSTITSIFAGSVEIFTFYKLSSNRLQVFSRDKTLALTTNLE